MGKKMGRREFLGEDRPWSSGGHGGRAGRPPERGSCRAGAAGGGEMKMFQDTKTYFMMR